jgi:AraC-like DNA-binding protein
MFVNLYLADIAVHEKKQSKRCEPSCRVFIREIHSAWSLPFHSRPAHRFSYSLSLLKRETNTTAELCRGQWLRVIQCQENARVHLLFKSVDHRYMFAVALHLKTRTVSVVSYEWSDVQRKHVRLCAHELLAIERQLIFQILQTFYIYRKQQISYLAMFRPEPRQPSG